MRKVSKLELFTKRYEPFIEYGNGMPVDNISDEVDFFSKKKICNILFEFNEPIKFKVGRYSDYEEYSDAFHMAIQKLNEFLGYELINMFEVHLYHNIDEMLASIFTPFLFNLIELQYGELSKNERVDFAIEINEIFEDKNLLFFLNNVGQIEKKTEYSIISPDVINKIKGVDEAGLREILEIAIEKFKMQGLSNKSIATEKIWDALERLKTYYVDLDKKNSAALIVEKISNGQANFKEIFEAEFKLLTTIGNDFRIRHHEINKTDIVDIRHYEYFFNRCLSLIMLAIEYLR